MPSPDDTPAFDVTFDVAAPTPPVDMHALSMLAARVMAGEGCAPGTSVAVLITGEDEIRALNRDFLGLDEPTDVLAFPDEPDPAFVVGEEPTSPHLGDIGIALPVAVAQADEAGHPVDAEVAHLLVHGILHLLGYDHVDGGEEERRMREREESYLGASTHRGRTGA